MNLHRYLLIPVGAVVGSIAGIGCVPGPITPVPSLPVHAPADDDGPRLVPPCVGTVVVIDDGQSPDCDVTPPQTLTVRFPGADGYDDAAIRQRCDDMGGVFALVNDHGITTAECDRVDY